MMEPEIIQRFLESVGQKADVDLYLKLFRGQKQESFAIISADSEIVQSALDPFHFDLRILNGLGLIPVVLLGLDGAREVDRQALRVQEWLVEDAVPARILDAGATMTPGAIDAVRATIAEGVIPLLSLEAAHHANADGRVKMLATLATQLAARRVIFLSRGAGLGPRNSPPLSVVNLGLDYEALVGGGTLSRRQTTLLRQVKQLLEQVPHRMSVAVVNPLHLLRELFTVSGAGSLIRRGSHIDTRSGWTDVDPARLRALFHSAFGKVLRPDFFETPVERTFIEEGYLGAAVIRDTPVGVYLTKFAVERQAQGEGIGGEIWTMLVREYPAFFWRARPANPINPWYIKQCDGMARFPDWYVFWRGIPIERIDPAIRYALAEPTDLI
jgi:bifunctional N-acetylglutamate synthase/kinase